LRGVMETGSQILLKADGGFQYMLAYEPDSKFKLPLFSPSRAVA
jgi:hypothetical protein